MKKILKYIVVELFVFFILIVFFPALLIREKIGLNIDGGKPKLPLQTGKFYTQKINNPTHSINSISLQLKNPQIKDNSLVYIEILDEAGELQKDFSIYGANIGDPSWIKLDFSPIESTNLVIRVSGESQFDNSLYLFADQNNNFDLKTSYALPTFKDRIFQNLIYQTNLFKQRSMWHNILYLASIVSLNLYLKKLLNEPFNKS